MLAVCAFVRLERQVDDPHGREVFDAAAGIPAFEVEPAPVVTVVERNGAPGLADRIEGVLHQLLHEMARRP